MMQNEGYTDFTNVEKQRNFLTAEEFPEGAYGSPKNARQPVQNKDTPWQEDQQFQSNFTYENRSLHEEIPRQMEGSHPTKNLEKRKRLVQPRQANVLPKRKSEL